jgi:hypothetical protein
MTLTRACQKTAVLWLRTYVLVLVLTCSPEYSLPQTRKLQVICLHTLVPGTQYMLPEDYVLQSRNLAVFFHQVLGVTNLFYCFRYFPPDFWLSPNFFIGVLGTT